MTSHDNNCSWSTFENKNSKFPFCLAFCHRGDMIPSETWQSSGYCPWKLQKDDNPRGSLVVAWFLQENQKFHLRIILFFLHSSESVLTCIFFLFCASSQSQWYFFFQKIYIHKLQSNLRVVWTTNLSPREQQKRERQKSTVS